ncbi:MAG: sugar transferase [Clostridia bacterium]|nr:sugar transferase [Clostridia bacterium]
MYKKYIKRLFDIVCAIFALVVFSWLYVIIAVLVRIFNGSPVIFKQNRTGLEGRTFTLYKFRTMTDKKDEAGRLLPDSKRLTRLGSFLRKTSLDELPQVFNIIKGDMSVVGPRPFIAELAPYYTERQMRRYDVRPGLTGLAQVNGRNDISWDEKFSWDLKYVDNITFFGDVKIVLKTIAEVFKSNDNEPGEESVLESFLNSRK